MLNFDPIFELCEDPLHNISSFLSSLIYSLFYLVLLLAAFVVVFLVGRMCGNSKIQEIPGHPKGQPLDQGGCKDQNDQLPAENGVPEESKSVPKEPEDWKDAHSRLAGIHDSTWQKYRTSHRGWLKEKDNSKRLLERIDKQHQDTILHAKEQKSLSEKLLEDNRRLRTAVNDNTRHIASLEGQVSLLSSKLDNFLNGQVVFRNAATRSGFTQDASTQTEMTPQGGLTRTVPKTLAEVKPVSQPAKSPVASGSVISRPVSVGSVSRQPVNTPAPVTDSSLPSLYTAAFPSADPSGSRPSSESGQPAPATTGFNFKATPQAKPISPMDIDPPASANMGSEEPAPAHQSAAVVPGPSVTRSRQAAGPSFDALSFDLSGLNTTPAPAFSNPGPSSSPLPPPRRILVPQRRAPAGQAPTTLTGSAIASSASQQQAAAPPPVVPGTSATAASSAAVGSSSGSVVQWTQQEEPQVVKDFLEAWDESVEKEKKEKEEEWLRGLEKEHEEYLEQEEQKKKPWKGKAPRR